MLWFTSWIKPLPLSLNPSIFSLCSNRMGDWVFLFVFGWFLVGLCLDRNLGVWFDFFFFFSGFGGRGGGDGGCGGSLVAIVVVWCLIFFFLWVWWLWWWWWWLCWWFSDWWQYGVWFIFFSCGFSGCGGGDGGGLVFYFVCGFGWNVGLVAVLVVVW